MPRTNPRAVFVNIPYDDKFLSLYLAYIVGLVHLGLEPKVTLGIPGGARRLDRIMDLIAECRYSIHDLSRVQVSPGPPRTPRFNMPFELGLAVSWAKQHSGRHTWFAFETMQYRMQRSLSDLDGTDPYTHGGTAAGVMRELCNAFVRPRASMPTVPQMLETYRRLRISSENIQRNTGANSLYEANVFNELVFVANILVRD